MPAPLNVRGGDINVRVGLYIMASLAVAAAPAWIRQVIVGGYDPVDKLGSGGDVYGWLGYSIVSLFVGVIMHIIVLVFAKNIVFPVKLLTIVSFVLVWLGAVAWVHHVGV